MAAIPFYDSSISFSIVGKTANNKDIVNWTLDDKRGYSLQFAQKLENVGKVYSQHGVTEEITLQSQRTFVIHTSYNHDPNKEVPLLYFFHGSRGSAWNCALQLTRWIERTNKEDFIVVFGQADGIEDPNFVGIHQRYQGLTFGERYWEIRDKDPGFQKDLQYIEDILAYVKSNHKINEDQIFFMGHSNGGVFALLLLLYVPRLYAAVCSHMGGIGWDPGYYLDFSLLKESDPKKPLLLITGDQDIHKQPCEAAKNIFDGEDFPVVDLVVQPDTKHLYKSAVEDFVWNWFKEKSFKGQ